MLGGGHLAILAGRDADNLLEDAREIVGIVVSHRKADLANRLMGRGEQHTGMLHLEVNEVIDRRISRLVFEQAQEM